MTKLDLLARIDRLVAEGAVSVHGLPEGVRLDELDEFACAVDLFGAEMRDVDVALDDLVTAKPTGHRRWDSYDREEDGYQIINTAHEYILD